MTSPALCIHKQQLYIANFQTLLVPHGAEFLHVAVQRGVPCVWYRCDPLSPRSQRDFIIVGTGRACPNHDEAKYLGTVLLEGDALVFHIFEQLGEPK